MMAATKNIERTESTKEKDKDKTTADIEVLNIEIPAGFAIKTKDCSEVACDD